MVTKIKEWWLPVVGMVLLGLAMLLWLSAPDQPKMSIGLVGEGAADSTDGRWWYGGKLTPMVIDFRPPPFNPATMEITRIDTVGWEWVRRSERWDTVAWEITMGDCCDTIAKMPFIRIIWDSTEVPITCSTIVPKTSPLLDRRQNEKLIEILDAEIGLDVSMEKFEKALTE